MRDSFHLPRKKFRCIVAVDLADQRVVKETFRVELGGFRHRRLLKDDLDRLGIDGHVLVPDFHAFLIASVWSRTQTGASVPS